MIIPQTFALNVLQLLHKNITSRVIVDVDIGIDDYQALTILLNAENNNQVKIEAIFCVDGNAPYKDVKKNVVRFLETAGRTDIPVYRGSHRGLGYPETPTERWFGEDGFGDMDSCKTKPDLRIIRNHNGMKAMYDIVKNNQGNISLIALGPLTNLAVASILYKDIISYFKEIYIMGGNYGAERAEFNFLRDPEAAKIVLDTTTVPTHILTWESCITVAQPLEWRFSIKLSNPVFDLMEQAEISQYDKINAKMSDNYNVCDASLAMAFLRPEYVTKQSKHCATVEVKEKGRGEVVIRSDCERNNVNIIETLDPEMFKSMFVEAFRDACVKGTCQNVC